MKPCECRVFLFLRQKIFTDWNGDLNLLNLILPVDAQPFERTQTGYVLDGATEIEAALVAVGQRLPETMIVDDKFIEAFSAMRRRPDGKSAGYIHDVIWQLAADFLIRHICSQNEFEACFRRLEQSARTWHTGPTSVNYLFNIQPYL